MSLHAIHPAHGDDAHREAQEALPWLANGRLAGAELERVQAHLQACALCRAELAELHTLRAAGPGDAPDCDVERALARVLTQLDEAGPVESAAIARAPTDMAPLTAAAQHSDALGWRARLAANDGRWLRTAVAMQCGVIAVLALLLARPFEAADAPANDYHLLGTAQGAQGSLIVVFKPDTPERELRSIVLASGAHVAGGPTATGAWVLATSRATATVAARLRAEPAVTLAEPLGAAAGP